MLVVGVLDVDWRDRAACRDADVLEFFVGGRAERCVARRWCGPCPVRDDCLADALAVECPGVRSGVRGGLTGPERDAVAKVQPALLYARRELVTEGNRIDRARERGPHRCAVDGCRCEVAA